MVYILNVMGEQMFTTQSLFDGHMPSGVRIGICSSGTSDKIYESTKEFGDSVTVYTDPGRMIDDLYEGRIDAAIRGDMSSSELLPIIKRRFGIDELERIVFLEPIGRKLIITAPVGIDEGWTIQQKHDLVTRSVRLMERIGMGTRIAIMSGGRKDDIGRCKAVDDTIRDALELVDILVKEGYDAYHSEILLENAVDEADLIIAPDGISGNLLFRSMHFIGGALALGAPVINIDKVYIDTSRAKKDYRDSIMLAMRLTEGKR